MYNLQSNIVQIMEDATTFRGSAHYAGGLADSRLSSPPGNAELTEPNGFQVFLTRSTRQYARVTVLDDPGALSLFLDGRLDIRSLFIVYMDNSTNNPIMIGHLKSMSNEKVGNTSLPRT